MLQTIGSVICDLMYYTFLGIQILSAVVGIGLAATAVLRFLSGASPGA